MFLIGLEIPIFWHTDETRKRVEVLEEDVPYEDYEVRRLVFYEVSLVSMFVDDGKEYGKVYSNGDEFISPMKVSELRELINNHQLRYSIFYLKS